MRRARRQIEHDPKTPLVGMTAVVLCIVCLLLLLSLIIALTRLALG